MADNLEFPNFFGTVKDLAQARYLMAERDKIKGDRSAGPDVAAALGGDREALGRVATQNPDMAMRLTTALSQMDYRQATLAKSHIELAGRLSAGILAAPPDQRPALYAAALDQARTLGIDTSKFPQDYGPATEGFLKHNLQMLGTATQVFKRVGAAGGGAPAGGGGGGWTNPVSPGARTSDAAPPGGPMVADAGGAAPPMAAPAPVAGMPQAAPAMAPPAQAPTAVAGAGPLPMALPPAAPRIAPTAAPAGAPVRVAGGAPTGGGAAPDDSGGEGDFVPPERVAGGRTVGLPPGAEVKVDAKGHPIETAGLIYLRLADKSLVMFDPKARKTFTPVPAGDQIHLVDNESGQTVRTIPVTKPREQIEPLGAPAAAATDPRAAVRGLNLPPGYRIGGVNGVPVVKDGTVLVVGPDGSHDFVPLPTRADPQQALDLAAAKAQANAKAIPPAVLHGIDANLSSLRKIDTVMAELAKNPDSVGGPGSVIAANIPGAGGLQNRMDKGGTQLRALIADIGSLKLHDRSGAAVTASEEPRLRPFIPSISDDPATVRTKLMNFKNEYMAVLRDQQAYYAPDNGFKPYKGLDDYMSGGGAPPAPSAAPAKPADKPILIYDPKAGDFK